MLADTGFDAELTMQSLDCSMLGKIKGGRALGGGGGLCHTSQITKMMVIVTAKFCSEVRSFHSPKPLQPDRPETSWYV